MLATTVLFVLAADIICSSFQAVHEKSHGYITGCMLGSRSDILMK